MLLIVQDCGYYILSVDSDLLCINSVLCKSMKNSKISLVLISVYNKFNYFMFYILNPIFKI